MKYKILSITKKLELPFEPLFIRSLKPKVKLIKSRKQTKEELFHLSWERKKAKENFLFSFFNQLNIKQHIKISLGKIHGLFFQATKNYQIIPGSTIDENYLISLKNEISPIGQGGISFIGNNSFIRYSIYNHHRNKGYGVEALALLMGASIIRDLRLANVNFINYKTYDSDTSSCFEHMKVLLNKAGFSPAIIPELNNKKNSVLLRLVILPRFVVIFSMVQLLND